MDVSRRTVHASRVAVNQSLSSLGIHDKGHLHLLTLTFYKVLGAARSMDSELLPVFIVKVPAAVHWISD